MWLYCPLISVETSSFLKKKPAAAKKTVCIHSIKFLVGLNVLLYVWVFRDFCSHVFFKLSAPS